MTPLATRVLSTRELVIWQGLPDAAAREAAFLRAWTRKEAYAKATGQGLFDTLTCIEVALDAVAPKSSLTLHASKEEGEITGSWVLYDLSAPDGFVAALAVAGGVLASDLAAWITGDVVVVDAGSLIR